MVDKAVFLLKLIADFLAALVAELALGIFLL
jgi:hypothetical protein